MSQTFLINFARSTSHVCFKNALNSNFDQATNLDPISSLAKDKQKLFQYIYVLLTPSQHLDTTLFLAFTNILVPYTESITKGQENQTSNTLFLAFHEYSCAIHLIHHRGPRKPKFHCD